MWELYYKESWAPKYWCFWTVVLEKTLESLLHCKEIQPVHPKGNQSRMFTGRADAEAKTSILWPPDVKNWLIWKDPDAGKDWRWEEKGTKEDEMVGWHQPPTQWTWVWISSGSWWCHPTISSSFVPFSSCLQSFPTSGPFQMSQLFASGGQNTGVSASTSVLPMNTLDWFPLGWTGWISLQSKGLARVFSNTTVWSRLNVACFFQNERMKNEMTYLNFIINSSL